MEDEEKKKKSGEISEDVVEEVLRRLQQQRVIKRFFKDHILDHRGIDFRVIRNNGTEKDLQVKTANTAHNFEKKKKKHLSRYPNVQAVIGVNTNLFKSDKERVYAIVTKAVLDELQKSP